MMSPGQGEASHIIRHAICTWHRIARRAISKPVSISALGRDLKTVPRYDEVLKWFA